MLSFLLKMVVWFVLSSQGSTRERSGNSCSNRGSSCVAGSCLSCTCEITWHTRCHSHTPSTRGIWPIRRDGLCIQAKIRSYNFSIMINVDMFETMKNE
jgi:hypothetical protein